jgi:hypothetical protein
MLRTTLASSEAFGYLSSASSVLREAVEAQAVHANVVKRRATGILKRFVRVIGSTG